MKYAAMTLALVLAACASPPPRMVCRMAEADLPSRDRPEGFKTQVMICEEKPQ